MKILIIDPLHNSPGEHDDDGAFEPGAEKLAATFGADATRFSFDNTFGYDARFAQLIAFVTGKQFDAIVEVSHGLHAKLQSGIDETNAQTLLGAFASPTPKKAVLFACSAASAPIESSIAYDLARYGLEVVAHSTVGHAYLNPYVVDVLPGGGLPRARPVVAFGSPHWRAWVRALRLEGDWLALARFVCGVGVSPRFDRDLDGFVRWLPIP